MIQAIKNTLTFLGQSLVKLVDDPMKYTFMISYKILCLGLGIWIIMYITSFVFKILGLGA